MWLPSGLPFMLGLFLYLSSGLEAQSRRPASRVFTTNIKSSSNSDFNCPEEFGYYPHPTDCSQYYVCVFGGALLESCTGGLMYSNELQTCDWPRNVGCELSDNIAPSAIDRQVTPRIPQVQTIQPQARTNQQQKFRFSSPSAPSSSGQGIPARVHAIPPPPQLKVAPNPVITSRGQPKFEEEKDLAELYAEAHETLPPVEEEESDRQQRVYRGQPSTVTQVQRDRDGLLHQPSVNAIPTHGKIGSFAFGSQIGQHRVEQSTQSPTVYIQQPSSRPIPQNNNRNYYNTTNSNQGYSNPSQFDSYYSVYDEDVELYRDIDYGQQYTTVTQKPIQSTYRPSTVSTQPPPRETYVKQEPVYEQRPVSSYNPDYDEALIAQLEGDSTYDHPPRNQLRTNSNTRNRGSSHFSTASGDDRPATVAVNRGTHPPRSRPTLKPSGTIVSKAQEFVDIYRNPPSRPEPLYPQPTPDKTAARCRKDVCLLPDCSCGGKEIPGNIPPKQTPQIVLITFDDAVNDLNKDYYEEIFERGRKNPNGCPITATFYVSHEWTDYGQVQSLYADGHEMASHTVSHSFGEQFSQKKWTREVAGQREILAAYGGVKLNDVRGMRAPFLSVGGNKMFKMLYDSNFTYDSSMPVYENRPPSWPYTLDYKIFHDCMIPPCPTKSYPGVWQVPMVMWQDLNGGRCSMGDACANPPESDGVMKMLMKNFDRHYTTNRAPFGLFYHAAWFTQPHHKEGFIKFLDTINAMNDVWIVTNWQALQWVRDPTPIERINQFQPFQCDYSDRPKRCNNPKVCNLWHKSGVRYMRTCQPCPDIYPWTGKTGIRSSRVDNDVEE